MATTPSFLDQLKQNVKNFPHAAAQNFESAKENIKNLPSSLKQTGQALHDAFKANYQAGPPQGAPSAGPGSVLDMQRQQRQPLMPQPQQQSLRPSTIPPLMSQTPGVDAVGTGAYGSQPGEQRIDVSGYQQPLGGLSGVKRQ